MKVILTQKVPGVGNIGDFVSVTVGFARNYLFPQKKALLADEKNKKVLAHHERALVKKMQDEKGKALSLKNDLEKISIEIFKRVGGNGTIFGSVTNAEISAALQEKGVSLEKRLISLAAPLKKLGDHVVMVKLFKEVEAGLKVCVKMDAAQVLELEEAAKNKKQRKVKDQISKEEKTAQTTETEIEETNSSQES